MIPSPKLSTSPIKMNLTPPPPPVLSYQIVKGKNINKASGCCFFFPLLRMCFYFFFYTVMTFGRLNCVMLDWFYCCLLPVGNSWHCSLFSIDIHFQQYCFLLDSCTVCASQTEYLPCCPQSLKSTNITISKICICYLTFSNFPFKLLFWLYFTTNESSIKDTVLPLKVTRIDSEF